MTTVSSIEHPLTTSQAGHDLGSPSRDRERDAVWWVRHVFGLMLVVGALYNVITVLRDKTVYTPFADAAHWSFIADTWRSTFVPHATALIFLLAAFEVSVGITILFGGRYWRLGVVAAMAFHGALLLFGWGIWPWSVPVLAILTWLLVRTGRASQPPTAPRQAT